MANGNNSTKVEVDIRGLNAEQANRKLNEELKKGIQRQVNASLKSMPIKGRITLNPNLQALDKLKQVNQFANNQRFGPKNVLPRHMTSPNNDSRRALESGNGEQGGQNVENHFNNYQNRTDVEDESNSPNRHTIRDERLASLPKKATNEDVVIRKPASVGVNNLPHNSLPTDTSLNNNSNSLTPPSSPSASNQDNSGKEASEEDVPEVLDEDFPPLEEIPDEEIPEEDDYEVLDDDEDEEEEEPVSEDFTIDSDDYEFSDNPDEDGEINPDEAGGPVPIDNSYQGVAAGSGNTNPLPYAAVTIPLNAQQQEKPSNEKKGGASQVGNGEANQTEGKKDNTGTQQPAGDKKGPGKDTPGKNNEEARRPVGESRPNMPVNNQAGNQVGRPVGPHNGMPQTSNTAGAKPAANPANNRPAQGLNRKMGRTTGANAPSGPVQKKQFTKNKTANASGRRRSLANRMGGRASSGMRRSAEDRESREKAKLENARIIRNNKKKRLRLLLRLLPIIGGFALFIIFFVVLAVVILAVIDAL